MFRHAAKLTLARIGDFNRSQFPFVARVARAAMDAVSKPQPVPIRDRMRVAAKGITGGRRGSAAPSGFGDIDPTAVARALAAYNEVFSYYQGLIEAVMANEGLTPEQRALAVRSLRQRQVAEASAAQRRIMEEAKAAARVRRKMRKHKL